MRTDISKDLIWQQVQQVCYLINDDLKNSMKIYFWHHSIYYRFFVNIKYWTMSPLAIKYSNSLFYENEDSTLPIIWEESKKKKKKTTLQLSILSFEFL